jgi:hypothetical protein
MEVCVIIELPVSLVRESMMVVNSFVHIVSVLLVLAAIDDLTKIAARQHSHQLCFRIF